MLMRRVNWTCASLAVEVPEFEFEFGLRGRRLTAGSSMQPGPAVPCRLTRSTATPAVAVLPLYRGFAGGWPKLGSLR